MRSAASGPIPSIEPTQLTQRGLLLAGGSVFTYIAVQHELQKRATYLTAALQAGWPRLNIAAGYPLEQAAKAHRAIATREAKGNLYLVPEPTSWSNSPYAISTGPPQVALRWHLEPAAATAISANA